jgi:hypothetical protein
MFRSVFYSFDYICSTYFVETDVMKKVIFSIIVSVFVFVAACSYEDAMDSLVPKQESEFAKEYFLLLRARDIESVRKSLDSRIGAQVSDEKLLELASSFPSGELLSTELVGSQVKVINGNWSGKFSFEYQFSGGWVLASVILKKTDGNLSVIGLNVYPIETSLKDSAKFTFFGKSVLHYLIIVSAVLAALFVLTSTYFCIRTPIPKRKWLWVVFVLTGVGSLSINWSTGQLGVWPLNIKLFSASAVSAGPYAPWVISVSIPLGAIIFWFKRKGFIAESRANDQVNSAASR